jgi:hypothetical protein
MASSSTAVAVLKVLLGSLLLVNASAEPVAVCDQDRPASHELSKHEKSVRLGITIAIVWCCVAMQYSTRFWLWLLSTTETYFVPHVVLIAYNLRLGGNELAQMVALRYGMIEQMKNSGLVNYYLRAFSLGYQILKSVDGKTYWLAVARMAGLVVLNAVAKILFLACGNLWTEHASIKWLGKKNGTEQRADRRMREAHLDGLHDDEVAEARRHRLWLCVQIALYLLVIAAYSLLFWLVLWPRYNHVDGCRNVVRMIVTYVVEVAILWTPVVLTLQLFPAPPVLIGDTHHDRGYLGTTNLPTVLAQVGSATINVAIDVWVLVLLIRSNVSDALFWLQWTAAAWSLVVLWYTSGHNHVRIWPGILPPESDDTSTWDLSDLHPLSLPPFDAPIYTDWPIARNVFSQYSDNPVRMLDIFGTEHQRIELQNPAIWGDYTDGFANFHSCCCCFSSCRGTAEKFSIHACMGAFAFDFEKQEDDRNKTEVRCCYCFRTSNYPFADFFDDFWD